MKRIWKIIIVFIIIALSALGYLLYEYSKTSEDLCCYEAIPDPITGDMIGGGCRKCDN